MMFILHDLHKDYGFVRDQTLKNLSTPTMEDLIDLFVPLHRKMIPKQHVSLLLLYRIHLLVAEEVKNIFTVLTVGEISTLRIHVMLCMTFLVTQAMMLNLQLYLKRNASK